MVAASGRVACVGAAVPVQCGDFDGARLAASLRRKRVAATPAGASL